MFVASLNVIYENIKFTVELEKDGCVPFLDIMVYRKEDGSLGWGVGVGMYRKLTHTNLYLNNSSHHYWAQKR